MPRFCRAFPLLPGKRPQLDAFIARLKDDEKGTDAFYRGYHVRRETVHLQPFGAGEIIIVCTDIDEPSKVATLAYQAARDEYNIWFKRQITDITGVDLDEQAMGPPTQLLNDWP